MRLFLLLSLILLGSGCTSSQSISVSYPREKVDDEIKLSVFFREDKICVGLICGGLDFCNWDDYTQCVDIIGKSESEILEIASSTGKEVRNHVTRQLEKKYADRILEERVSDFINK